MYRPTLPGVTVEAITMGPLPEHNYYDGSDLHLDVQENAPEKMAPNPRNARNSSIATTRFGLGRPILQKSFYSDDSPFFYSDDRA